MNENWENKTLEYDITKYPWNDWVLEEIKKLFPRVEELDTIHEYIDEKEIFSLCVSIQQLFMYDLTWMKRLSNFAKEYIPPLIDHQDFLIKRNPTLNLVVPNQQSIGRRLPFHQGIFYDNGRDHGTIWMPLTESFDTNAMWIINTDESKEITKKVIKNNWNLKKFEEECLKVAYPVTLSPGQAHLFNQESIHGNVNNTTNKTRMAFDWHVLPKGGEYHRRLPGGFFRHPDDYSQNLKQDYSQKRYITYLSNNHSMSIDWPKNFQRAIIDNYLDECKITNNAYHFENEFLDHMPILDHFLEEKIDGIVMCSIYQLPSDCEQLLQKALKNRVTLHFANERLVIESVDDINKIIMYRNWGTPKKDKYSWE